MDDEKYPYDELALILFTGNSKSINGVSLNHKIQMTLFFSDKEHFSYPFPSEDEFYNATAKFEYERGLIPTNAIIGKKLEFIYEYLSNKTFENRINKYFLSLKKYGKFTVFRDYFVFNDNGDLYENGKFIGNFKERYEKDKLINGLSYGGYSNKTTDPFIYGFEKGTKYLGLISDNFEFRNIINRDIMSILFNNLYKTGKMSGSS
jgi:hypothetical protein